MGNCWEIIGLKAMWPPSQVEVSTHRLDLVRPGSVRTPSLDPVRSPRSEYLGQNTSDRPRPTQLDHLGLQDPTECGINRDSKFVWSQYVSDISTSDDWSRYSKHLEAIFSDSAKKYLLTVRNLYS
jgi:hypothetical protein